MQQQHAISQFSCTEAPTKWQKCFPSPLPSLSVVWKDWQFTTIFWQQSNIDKGERGKDMLLVLIFFPLILKSLNHFV